MFDEICSIYSDALDNVGRYVDRETGECIQQMTIREFCLTDRWKPYVQHLRPMRQEYGSKAKKMQEYIDTKKQLPGATLSGLFSIYDDECIRRDGSKFMAPVSRRETHLKQHTGWLAIDIDLADNMQMSNFENVRMICRFRPEIGLLMRSCSGSGYFGLVKLAYPDRHKEQFKALLKDYAAIGITLDKACSNIGRVRFASWDDPEHIYINEQVMPYRGVAEDTQHLIPQTVRQSYRSDNHVTYNDGGTQFWEQQRVQDRLIDVIAQELVAQHKNITESYDEWTKVGWALRSHPYGLDLFHQLSRCSQKYNEGQTNMKWKQLGNSQTVTYNYLIHACKVELGEDAYRKICRRVWSEMNS